MDAQRLSNFFAAEGDVALAAGTALPACITLSLGVGLVAATTGGGFVSTTGASCTGMNGGGLLSTPAGTNV
jgi:hypothetical protein